MEDVVGVVVEEAFGEFVEEVVVVAVAEFVAVSDCVAEIECVAVADMPLIASSSSRWPMSW